MLYLDTKAEEQSTSQYFLLVMCLWYLIELNKVNFTIKELENALEKMKDKEKKLEVYLKKLAREKKNNYKVRILWYDILEQELC